MDGLGCILSVKLLFEIYLIKIEFYLVRTDKLPNDILADILEIHYKNRGLHPKHIESINRLILVSISDVSLDKKGTFVLNTLLNFGHTQCKIDEFAFFIFFPLLLFMFIFQCYMVHSFVGRRLHLSPLKCIETSIRTDEEKQPYRLGSKCNVILRR